MRLEHHHVSKKLSSRVHAHDKGPARKQEVREAGPKKECTQLGARAKGACHASEQRKRGRQRQAIYRPPAAHLCRQRICVSIPAFKHMRCASDANFTRAGPGQAGRAGAARQHLLRIEVGRQVAREDADHDKALLQAVRSAPAVSPDTQQAARAKDKRRRWHSATSSRWTALMFPYKCATTVLHQSHNAHADARRLGRRPR